MTEKVQMRQHGTKATAPDRFDLPESYVCLTTFKTGIDV